jgi:transposase
MYDPVIKSTIEQLHQAGKSIREISRFLKLSRNTVRSIVRQKSKTPLYEEHNLLELIRTLMASCKGNLVRVHELLTLEHQQNIAYSTLTYWVRKYELRETPSPHVGEYLFEPGEEMQHDTSPHWLELDGKKVKAQCASLIFGFSRMLFVQYYPRFSRFEAKSFLSDALVFMQSSCKRCVIDNTSVILEGGAGAHAVVASEMLFFSRVFGFQFMAHAVNHADRKGKIERPFYYAQTNFLAGRVFNDWQDLNSQARAWCEAVNQKVKRHLGQSPKTRYQQERPYCIDLPKVLPPIYNQLQRTVNSEGYISVETQRYSVPERLIGQIVDVYHYMNHLDIFYQHQKVATHQRATGKAYQRICDKNHHPTLRHCSMNKELSETQRRLTGLHPVLDLYLNDLKSQVRGRGFSVFKRLLYFKELYPHDAFIAGIINAQEYRLYDMNRLEHLILRFIQSDFFNL